MKRLLAVASLGSVVGVGVLGVDLGLLRWTLGYLGDFDPSVVLAYAAAGALFAAATHLEGARRGALAPPGSVLCLASAWLYLPAILERSWHASAAAEIPGRELLALLAGLGTYLGWFALLRWVSGSLRWAGALCALSAALALAGNRNLAPGAFSAPAVRLDLAIAAFAVAVAFTVRLRGRLRVLAGAGALAGALLLPALGPTEKRVAVGRSPGDNLFLVVIDTLRLDVFSDVVERTPEGARFARALSGATWFDNATAIAPWTAPSMASILTGLYPAEHGFDSPGAVGSPIPPLAPQIETLAQRLTRRGYHCEGLVTQPYIRPGTGMERGFAHYELVESAGERLPLLVALNRAGLVETQAYQPAASVRRRLGERLERLAGRRSSLFFFVHLLDPHVPLHSHPQLSVEASERKLPLGEDLYRQEVRYALAEVAGMIELLAERGLLGQSVVAVTADHGELFESDERLGQQRGDGGRERLTGHGGALYGELLRVPLVVRPANPDASAPARHSDALASHVDLLPTLLELLDQTPPPAAERFSLAGAIAGRPQSASRRTSAPSGVNVAGLNPALPAQMAIRDQRYWLIDYLDQQLPDELYDLSSDPQQRRNLASDLPLTMAESQAKLAQARPWMTPPPIPIAPADLDEATRRRLRALGYL